MADSDVGKFAQLILKNRDPTENTFRSGAWFCEQFPDWSTIEKMKILITSGSLMKVESIAECST